MLIYTFMRYIYNSIPDTLHCNKTIILFNSEIIIGIRMHGSSVQR